ncbi:MAG: glycosyltransferase [Capsulimonadaceae bacterium]|nr:glycosyltransferase [Capsulimonadaceae bacterium]
MTIYHEIVLALTAGLFLNAIVNLLTFRKPRAPIIDPDVLPFISILVPARNEERHIEACVEALLAQNYPHYEVIVLDDESTDATYAILHAMRDRDDRLRIMVGASLAEGWCGKPHACWQLARAATGDYVLFTDADCRLAPDALLLALGAHIEHDADLVSMMPEYIASTFWERVVIPLLVMIPIAFLPITAVRGMRWPLMAAANGAFLFMRREEYLRCGGHAAVRDQLAEDVKFAQHVKRFGLTEWYGDGIKVYSVRMYESLDEIWRGFRKNLFAAFSRKLSILIPGLTLVTIVMILPLPLTLAGLALHASWTLLPAAAFALTVLIRLGTCWFLGRDDPAYAFLNPLSWLIAILIAFSSIRDHYGNGHTWKGRLYDQQKK